MSGIEQAARAEAIRQMGARRPDNYNAGFHAGFQSCTSWLSEHLLSNESVKRGSEADSEHSYDDHRIGYCICGEKPLDMSRHRARAVLSAVLGTNNTEGSAT